MEKLRLNENECIAEFLVSINKKFKTTNYILKESENLFYEMTVNQDLILKVRDIKKPTRGESAFQTDICLYEKRYKDSFPLVVFEFKLNPSTHDIIVYSAKARKHKQVYPWLRYGMLVCGTDQIPINKFLKHNEFLDFCVSVRRIFDDEKINDAEAEKIINFIHSEISIAKTLESVCFDNPQKNFYQNRIVFDGLK